MCTCTTVFSFVNWLATSIAASDDNVHQRYRIQQEQAYSRRGQESANGAKVTSREKQLSRWYQNERVSYELHMLPFIQALLAGLASQTLVLAIDGSGVGYNRVTLLPELHAIT